MNLFEPPDGLDFHDQSVARDQVRNVIANDFSRVHNFQWILLFHDYARFAQIKSQRVRIHFFDKPAAQSASSTIGASDDRSSLFIYV